MTIPRPLKVSPSKTVNSVLASDSPPCPIIRIVKPPGRSPSLHGPYKFLTPQSRMLKAKYPRHRAFACAQGHRWCCMRTRTCRSFLWTQRDRPSKTAIPVFYGSLLHGLDMPPSFERVKCVYPSDGGVCVKICTSDSWNLSSSRALLRATYSDFPLTFIATSLVKQITPLRAPRPHAITFSVAGAN